MNKAPARKKGQSALEITLIIAVIVAALIAMAPALGRRIKGYVNSNASSISQQNWGSDAVLVVTSNSVSDSDSNVTQTETDSVSNTTQDFQVGNYQ